MEARSQFLKRYGQVDVFSFDRYSLALAKVQRANRQDVVDVPLLGVPIIFRTLRAIFKSIARVSPGNSLLEPISANHFLPAYELSTEDDGDPVKRVHCDRFRGQVSLRENAFSK